MENAKTFGAQADTYAAARPGYPEELFDWIAAQAPDQQLVWDVGTGSGQAALSLAARFKRVHATDLDPAQIAAAGHKPNINYHIAQSHESGLEPGAADAVTVATALHWFDFNQFWPEVRRVSRPGALFCAWTYHRAVVDPEVESLLYGPVLDILKPYWSDGNRLSWAGYPQDQIHMPFERIETPEFSCDLAWSGPQIAAFSRSWSAHKRARMDGHEEALAAIESKALAALGESPRTLTLPLHVIAARVG